MDRGQNPRPLIELGVFERLPERAGMGSEAFDVPDGATARDALVEKARKLSGFKEKTAVVHAGLEALIARESARRLAALGGSEPRLRAVRRRRPLRGPGR